MRPHLVLLALTIGSPSPARANCALPVTYGGYAVGNEVTVQPWNFLGRGCGGAEEMLRQDAATGETVRLAEFCGPQPEIEASLPYVDECVPAGTYRYGFGTPYTCEGSACGTYRFLTVSVTAELDPGCSRSAGNEAPAPVEPVGWAPEDRLICGYDDPAADSWDFGQVGCGCGTASAGVLGVDALAAAVGLALLRRRRTARR